LIGGLFLLAATTVVFGLADDFGLLVTARLLQGLASACGWTAGFTWLVGVTSPERRGVVIGSTLGVAIAGALAGPALGAVASVAGTAPSFGTVGAAALVLALVAARTPAPQRGAHQPLSMLVYSLRDTAILTALWLILLPALLFGTESVLIPLRLSDLGFGSVAIGAIFFLSAAGEALLAPVVGRFSDRRGRLVPLRIGLLASAVVAALMPWPDERFVLALLAIAAGSAFGTFWAPAMAWLTDAAEHRGLETAYVFALMNLAWAPGQAIGAAVSGGVADISSDAVPWLVLSTLCAVTLAALRSVVALRPVQPPA
jgi:MFS family permease